MTSLPRPPVAIAGMELMEARFVQAVANLFRDLRYRDFGASRAPKKSNASSKPCELADRGYQYFAQVAKSG